MTTDTTGTDEAIQMHQDEAKKLRALLLTEKGDKNEAKRASIQELIDHHEAEVKNLRGSLG